MSISNPENAFGVTIRDIFQFCFVLMYVLNSIRATQ